MIFPLNIFFSSTKGSSNLVILSPQQEEIITKSPHFPAIITGHKGTGKTTTALYSALIEEGKLEEDLPKNTVFN